MIPSHGLKRSRNENARWPNWWTLTSSAYKRRGASATERLDAAATFWRSRLGVPPLETLFTTDLNIPAPARPLAGSSRAAPSSPVFEVNQLRVVIEISDADRDARLAATHSPLDFTLNFRQGFTRHRFLVPITYRLRTPLSAEEREMLRRQQVAELAYFDKCLAETCETLARLVEPGADPVSVLSLLLRYARLQEPEFPLARTERFNAYDFVAVIPHRRRELPLVPLLHRDVPVRLETRRTVTPPPLRRRPGRGWTGMNVGMALLARHLKRYAKRPHYATIGALFRVWGRPPSELKWGDVWRRISRVTKGKHEKDFSRLALEEEQLARAENRTLQASSQQTA